MLEGEGGGDGQRRGFGSAEMCGGMLVCPSGGRGSRPAGGMHREARDPGGTRGAWDVVRAAGGKERKGPHARSECSSEYNTITTAIFVDKIYCIVCL